MREREIEGPPGCAPTMAASARVASAGGPGITNSGLRIFCSAVSIMYFQVGPGRLFQNHMSIGSAETQ